MPKIVTGANKPYLIIVSCLLLVALAVAVYSWVSTSQAGDYRAVFLTNNQVYFGQIAGENNRYLTLTSVFYVQDRAALEDAATASDIALIKSGREVHGPTDTVQIARDQILLVQTLSESSKVLAAIQQYKNR